MARKLKYTNTCKWCNNIFMAASMTKDLCSVKCYDAFNRDAKYENTIEGYDYIRCPECNVRMGEITLAHAKNHGSNTIKEFLDKHDMKTGKCQKLVDKFSGENNPGYKHGGTLSPFSHNNTRFTAEEIKSNQDKAVAALDGKRNNQIQKWIDLGYTEEEAKEKVKERQATNTVEKIMERDGITLEEATEKRAGITEKWVDSMNKSTVHKGYSSISLEMFDVISYAVPDILYGKNEKRIRINNDVISVDCYLESSNRIIEFFGDYWHARPTKYKPTDVIKKNGRPSKNRSSILLAEDIWNNDNNRINCLEQDGYKVMIVWERDYNDDKIGVIERCIDFLTK